MYRWVGKVAIVSGASLGIGKAISAKLVEERIKVVGLGRNADRLQSLAHYLKGRKGEFIPLPADMTNEEDIIKAFQWTNENVGPVNILINNAGIYIPVSAFDLKTKDVRAMLDLNVSALCIATSKALTFFKENKIPGHIININSTVGHRVMDIDGIGIYQASKFAVTAFTKSVQLELKKVNLGVKVTSISPGLVDTNLSVNSKIKKQIQSISGYAVLQPDDVANATLFALSTPPHCQVEEITVTPIPIK